MTTKTYLLLVVLFFLSVVVAYQVAAWQMTPKHAQLLVAVKGPDTGVPGDKPGPQIPVDPPANNHDIPCDPSKDRCQT